MNYPQPPAPQAPMAAPPAKKKGSGCLLAVGILAAVMAIIFAVGAFIVYRVVKSPEGQKAVTLIGEGTKVMREATTAPGTSELRSLGCAQALVVDTARMEALGQLIAEDAGKRGAEGDFKVSVVCQASTHAAGLTCDALAETYVHAAAPAAPFLVTLTVVGAPNEGCSAVYDVSGTKTRNVH